MRRTATVLAALLLVPASYAGADEAAERTAMIHVRLTTEPAHASGCTRVGSANDDSVKDLRRKIVRAGGNVGLISFRPDDLSVIHAEIFRCPAAARPAPPGVPPPPPGPPPPGPPPPPAPPAPR